MCNRRLLVILRPPEMPPLLWVREWSRQIQEEEADRSAVVLFSAVQPSQPSGSKRVKTGLTPAEQAADNLGERLLSASSMELQANHISARIKRPNPCALELFNDEANRFLPEYIDENNRVLFRCKKLVHRALNYPDVSCQYIALDSAESGFLDRQKFEISILEEHWDQTTRNHWY